MYFSYMFRNLPRLFAMDGVADTGIHMQLRFRDGFVHDIGITDGRHAVIFAPEDIGGHGDVVEQGTQVFGRDLDERLAHHRTRFLVIVDADEPVQELLAERCK